MVIVAGTAVHAFVAKPCGSLCGYAVTRFEHGYALADFQDDAGKLMAQNHGGTIAELILADMEICTADTGGLYFHQELTGTWFLRVREIDIGDMSWSLFCFDNCFHASYHLSMIGCGYAADVRYA